MVCALADVARSKVEIDQAFIVMRKGFTTSMQYD